MVRKTMRKKMQAKLQGLKRKLRQRLHDPSQRWRHGAAVCVAELKEREVI